MSFYYLRQYNVVWFPVYRWQFLLHIVFTVWLLKYLEGRAVRFGLSPAPTVERTSTEGTFTRYMYPLPLYISPSLSILSMMFSIPMALSLPSVIEISSISERTALLNLHSSARFGFMRYGCTLTMSSNSSEFESSASFAPVSQTVEGDFYSSKKVYKKALALRRRNCRGRIRNRAARDKMRPGRS